MWRLVKYMSESEDWMNLELHNVTVHCEALGEATLRRDKCIWSLLQAVAAHQPDVIFTRR